MGLAGRADQVARRSGRVNRARRAAGLAHGPLLARVNRTEKYSVATRPPRRIHTYASTPRGPIAVSAGHKAGEACPDHRNPPAHQVASTGSNLPYVTDRCLSHGTEHGCTHGLSIC
jgi:hypothetical protein